MLAALLILLIGLLRCNDALTQSGSGNVFPIPLTEFNDDPKFVACSAEHEVYAHTTNCSLFHVCHAGVHAVYSCIDAFFFNPISSHCQYWPWETGVRCHAIVKQMLEMDFFPVAESVGDYTQHRKSATSPCTQLGIYPDVLDCSLFHYCHDDRQHEIFPCPTGLRFDPRTFMCSAASMVNCQYEPSKGVQDEMDQICRDYAPGTYLPVANKIDEFILCKNDSRHISMKCKSGLIYNALTTSCEKGPCTFDSTLCQNEGQCIDEPTIERGFRCVCSRYFQGEFCEKDVRMGEETTEPLDPTSDNVNRQFRSNIDSTTYLPYIETVDLLLKDEATTIYNIYSDIFQDESLPQLVTAETILVTEASNSSMQSSELSQGILQQQQQLEQMIKIVLIVFSVLIGLISCGSIIVGIWAFIRCNGYPRVESVGKWRLLAEDFKAYV